MNSPTLVCMNNHTGRLTRYRHMKIASGLVRAVKDKTEANFNLEGEKLPLGGEICRNMIEKFRTTGELE